MKKLKNLIKRKQSNKPLPFNSLNHTAKNISIDWGHSETAFSKSRTTPPKPENYSKIVKPKITAQQLRLKLLEKRNIELENEISLINKLTLLTNNKIREVNEVLATQEYDNLKFETDIKIKQNLKNYEFMDK